MQELMDGLGSFAEIHDSQDIVIQIDAHHLIIRINQVAEKHFNTKEGSVINQNLLDIAKKEKWDFPFVEHILEVDLKQDIGNPQLYFWKVFPLFAHDNNLTGYIIIGHHNHDPYGHSFSKLYLENVIANVPNYIFWKDVDSTYLGCNDNFAKLVGLSSAKEIFGKTDFDFYDNEKSKKFIEEDKRVLSGIAILNRETQHGVDEGQIRMYSKSKVPLRNMRQEIIGILGIYSDINQQKMIEEQLRDAKLVAEKVSNAKTEFIANISHDLRTSLNVILGMSKLLRMRKHYFEQENLIDGLAEASHALMHQIDEIIDYSKIEEGKVTISRSVFDLRELIESIVDLQSFEASLKDLNLIIDYGPDIPVYIDSDPVSIKRILLNLIGNAVKFCEQGHVKISVSCLNQRSQAAVMEISVADTGIGIPEDKLESIFERFTRVEKTYQTQYKGTGLGLSIVSSLVQRLDGQVTVDSVFGEGATFKVNLPVAICAPRDEKVIVDLEPNYPKVLLISDDPVMSRVLLKLLPKDKAESAQSNLAMDAIINSVNNKNPYDLVVIDDVLIYLTVAELLDQLNHYMLLNKSHIIFMTRPAYDSNRSANAPYIGYERISKPIKPSIFAASLHGIWTQRFEQKTDDVKKSHASKRVLLVEDELLGQKYCKILFDNLEYELDIAASGKQALELVENNQYGLILMDIGLPDISGIEVTQILRKQERYQHLPIIALTAHLDVEKKQECLDAGMSDFINKPVSPEDLYAILERVFC